MIHGSSSNENESQSDFTNQNTDEKEIHQQQEKTDETIR